MLSRRDGTVNIIFHDGTGRYVISSATGRDGTFFSTARAVHFFLFSRRDGTVRIYFHGCRGERNEEHTALATKAAMVQVKVMRRTYHIICTVLYVHYQ